MCTRRQWHSSLIQQLRNLEDKARHTQSLDVLRGYEGRAASVYFKGFAEAVPAIWNFQGRMKHPPTDPINCMLSFGYSCLYHHITTALQICSLNPTIGWFHEPRNNYMALASDLQEEFRYLVDGLILYLLNRNMVHTDHFTINPNAKYPVLMNMEFKKVFISQLEERLITEFKPDEKKDLSLSYRNFFIHQARQIVTISRHPENRYKPLRIH